MRLREWVKVERRRRSLIGNDRAALYVRRTRRAVRIVAIVEGKPTACVHLDDAQVDRLVGRLQAIRGGRKALP